MNEIANRENQENASTPEDAYLSIRGYVINAQKQVLKYISERLTAESGKGFDTRHLRNMRQFYLTFPKRSTLWSELS